MAKSKRDSHPWVMAAFICQSTLEEKDNVLSAIRIVDRFTVPKPPDWNGKKPLTLPLHVLIGFKSDGVKGERKVRIYVVSPNLKRKKAVETTAMFLGAENGVNLRINISFGFKSVGTFWLEVYVEKWLATRIPLTIVWDESQDTLPRVEPGRSPAGKNGRPD